MKSSGFKSCPYCDQSGVTKSNINAKNHTTTYHYFPPSEHSNERTHNNFLRNAKVAQKLNNTVCNEFKIL